jgi:hypothetical protein
MPARKAEAASTQSIGEAALVVLHEALQATQAHVLGVADVTKAALAESSREVARIRRTAKDDDADELRQIVDAQRGHAKKIDSTVAAHKAAIADLARDLDEIFKAP